MKNLPQRNVPGNRRAIRKARRAELEARDREMYPELYAVGGAA